MTTIQKTNRGINETLLHLQREYYFPKMKSKITTYINNCDICKITKYDRKPPSIKFKITETPRELLEVLQIDVFQIDKLHILTIIDKFSRFADGYILNNRNSLELIKHLRTFIKTYGKPGKVVVDSAQEFNAIILKDFLKSLDCELHTTSLHSSNSNSPVERLHSTLIELYRITKKENKTLENEEIIKEILITYNNRS